MCDRIQPRQEIRFTPTTLAKWLSPLVSVNWRLGAITLAGCLVSLYSGNRVLAQSNIVADDTLGADSSVVIQNFNGAPTEVITGGAERGQNLFHSFQEFNVGANRNAFFFSPNADIQNILARVTGGNPSEILGVLGTFGNSEPNLFLMNPRGIVFGPNARLAVGGSFVASTADSLVFENGFEFGATNPEAPPLLTINVPVGLQYGANPGRINNQSRFGLRVQPERTLALVGGEVDLEGGILSAPNGRVELGSVADNSLVNLLQADVGYSLDYERVEGFQDIRLSRAAEVESSGGDSSSIWVQGRNIFLTGGSQIFTFTRGAEAGGNLNVNASESVELIGGGGLSAITVGTGNGGDLALTTQQLLVQAGAQISASTFSEGDGGTLTVEVEELVQLVGTSANGFSSGVFAATTGKGDGGNLTLTAGQLLVRDGAVVSANTFSEGNGGTLAVEVEDLVQVKGIAANGRFPSSIGAETRGTGNGGNLTLTTRQLLVQDGATVSASTVGEGNGGTLTVKASDSVQLTGTTPNGRFGSGIGVETRGTGNGGNLTLMTRQLLVQGGATVSVSTFGEGDGGTLTVEVEDLAQVIGTTPNSQFVSGVFAQTTGTGDGGNLTLAAGQLLVRDGAAVSASTVGEGNGGTLTVEVSELVRVIGIAPNGRFASGIGAGTQGTGNGGDVRLTAGQLLVREGAQLSVNTFNEGDSGTLIVEVEDLVQVIGTAPNGLFPSGIGAETQGTGDGGDVRLTAGQLLVQDGATVSASTNNEGDGGTLTVEVTDLVQVIGTAPNGLFPSSIRAETLDLGDGGDVRLTAGQLLVQDGATVSASTFNEGNGGTLTVEVTDLVQVIGTTPNGLFPSSIRAETLGLGDGGDVRLTAGQLLVQDGATVSASTFGEGNGGTLILNVSESILVDRGAAIGVVSFASGNGGDLILTTDQLTIQNNSAISVSSTASRAGNLTITADTLTLNNNSQVSAETGITGAEEGANIILQDLDLLLLENESLISATALEDANGGNVTINADFIVAKSPTGPEGSDITANADRGNGGRVSVTSNGLFGIEFRPQLTPLNDITVSSQFGLAGDFIENTPGIDPSQGLATLPSNLVDPESLIDRSCTPGSAALQSSFIITGRGGIPTSPTDPLSSNDVVSEWVTLDTEEETTAVTETPTNSTSATPERIIEAQGWIVNERGQVVLVANAPTVSPQTPRQTTPSCEDIRASAHE